MAFFIQFVADTAPFIYAVCGFLALLQLYRTWQSRAERRQAIFSLEREKALNDLYNIFLSAMVLLLVMGLTYFVSTTLARAVEPVVAETLNPQPQAIPLIPTPTNTPLPTTPTPAVTPTGVIAQQETIAAAVVVQQTTTAQQAVATATLSPPTSTPPPASVAVAPALCPDGRSAIVSPGNGAVVGGSVAIVGTAQHDQFSYYKLEFAPGSAASQGYVYFDGGQSQVVGGLLGNLNSSSLSNGVYTIQLVVVDSTGNYPQPCRVSLTVQN